MRIDLNHGPQATPESNRNSAQSITTSSGSSSNALGEDQAQLSGAHVQVQALAAQASQLPEVREERVQALRQAIESGQYRVNPDHVAHAVLAHMVADPAA